VRRSLTTRARTQGIDTRTDPRAHRGAENLRRFASVADSNMPAKEHISALRCASGCARQRASPARVRSENFTATSKGGRLRRRAHVIAFWNAPRN
jgi:hypothetical protein